MHDMRKISAKNEKIRGFAVALLVLLLLLGNTIAVSAANSSEHGISPVEKYKHAREKYKNAVERYKEAREHYLEARNRFMKHRNASNLNITLERAKIFLLRTTDAMIGYIEMVERRVEFSKLSEEDKAGITGELEEYKNWLENKQDEIERAESREDIIGAAKEIREKWFEIRGNVKKIAGMILSSHIDTAIERAENIADRIEAVIEKMKEEGKETEELESLLSDFREKIELAKEKNEKAKEKFREIKNIKDADKLFREGHDFLKKANSYLREAFRDLKKIILEIKKQQGGGEQ